MNTNELYSPSNWLTPELKESEEIGLMRIEISHYADDLEAE